jgi:hypothetical protein
MNRRIDEAVAARAHELWEQAGKPEGREEDFGAWPNRNCSTRIKAHLDAHRIRLGNLAGGLSKTQTGNGLAADGSSVIPIGKPKGLERFPYRSFDLVAVQALVRRVAAP